MYLIITFIIISIGIYFYKQFKNQEILNILLCSIFLILIETENNFYKTFDFLSKYSLVNLTLLILLVLIFYSFYYCYKNKKLSLVLLPSIIFFKWLPFPNTITCLLSLLIIVFIGFRYYKEQKLNLIVLTFIVLGLHIIPDNNYKPTKLPILGIGSEVSAYEKININEVKNLEKFKSIYIMPTSLFKANNFQLMFNSLSIYSKTDYCLLKNDDNFYNCSFYNIDAKKKQNIYKKYEKIQQSDYLELGKRLVENHVKNENLKKQYLNNLDKLVLIGMLEVYNNYRYIYANCDLYNCSNKLISGNHITTECFINNCNDNEFLINIKDQIISFIDNKNLEGEILMFKIINTN